MCREMQYSDGKPAAPQGDTEPGNSQSNCGESRINLSGKGAVNSFIRFYDIFPESQIPALL